MVTCARLIDKTKKFIVFFSTGGSSTIVTTQELAKSCKLIVPPHTSIRSKLMVKMAKNVAVPFVATIEKKRNGIKTILREEGVWKGVLMTETYIENSNI